MTLQTLASPLYWPCMVSVSQISGVNAGNTLDATGEYDSMVFMAKEAMAISHVGWRNGTATNSPTAEVRIETVDTTTGLPTGTLWATDTNGTTGVLTANTWVLQALTATANITAGQIFCVKVLWGGVATSVHTVNLFINMIPSGWGAGLPYKVVNTGTPTKSAITGQVYSFALGSSTTAFYNVIGTLPFSTSTSITFSNSVAGAKRGLKFQIPFTCRVIGIRHYGNNSTGDFNVIVEDGSGNELNSSSTAVDASLMANSAAGAQTIWLDNSVTLVPGTYYRVMIEPTSATNTVIYTHTLPSADYRTAWPGGVNFFYTTYTTGGGYVDTATDQVPLFDIVIDQLDDGGVNYVVGG